MITTLPDITDATRREFLAILGAAGLLTACGSDDDSDGDGTDTRTVDSANGPVQIPTDPQRVATTFYPTLMALATLGVPLVATAGTSLDQIADLPAAFVPPGLDGLTDIGSQDSPNLEVLATTEPDLIIEFSDRDQAVNDAFARIAPTVLLDYAGPPSWREHAADVARVVGRENRLAEVIARFDEAAAAAAAAVPHRGRQLLRRHRAGRRRDRPGHRRRSGDD